MKNNQKGFANVILVTVIVVLVGVVGYFAFVKNSGPIAQQPTLTPTKTIQTKTPTPTPVISSTYLKIPELGIQIKLTNDIKDLVYARSDTQISGVSGINSATYGLSTRSLATIDSSCSASSNPLGKIFRTSTEVSDGPGGTYVKVGNFYISYQTPQDVCSDKNGVADLTRLSSPALRAALKLAEPISN